MDRPLLTVQGTNISHPAAIRLHRQPPGLTMPDSLKRRIEKAKTLTGSKPYFLILFFQIKRKIFQALDALSMYDVDNV